MAKNAVSAPETNPELKRRKRNIKSSKMSGTEKAKSGRKMLEYVSRSRMKQQLPELSKDFNAVVTKNHPDGIYHRDAFSSVLLSER
jgi:hypothetical protein